MVRWHDHGLFFPIYTQIPAQGQPVFGEIPHFPAGIWAFHRNVINTVASSTIDSGNQPPHQHRPGAGDAFLTDRFASWHNL
jgi:hypothetical protein